MPEHTDRPFVPSWEARRNCTLAHTRKKYDGTASRWVRGESEDLEMLKASNGRISFHLRCRGCGYRSSAMPFRLLPEWNLDPQRDVARVQINPPGTYAPCVVKGCYVTPTEYHHFSPYNTFGADADSWPVLPLCRPHHVEWHQRMDGYKWHAKRAA